MNITKYKLNTKPITLLDLMIEEKPDYNQVSFKNINYEEAKRYLNIYCDSIISRMLMHIRKLKKYQYVFIKNGLVKENSRPGYWHLDSSLNPTEEYENYIFLASYNLTEFVDNPIKIEEAKDIKDFDTKINSNSTLSIYKLAPFFITKYYGNNVHRIPRFTVSEQRLLIRLTNTDNKLMPIYPVL
jgi:hypothetical protein